MVSRKFRNWYQTENTYFAPHEIGSIRSQLILAEKLWNATSPEYLEVDPESFEGQTLDADIILKEDSFKFAFQLKALSLFRAGWHIEMQKRLNPYIKD
jgi:hypothetical protein